MCNQCIEWDGRTWHSHGKSYYYWRTKKFGGHRQDLHRAIYEKAYGRIPIGYCIHHEDGNIYNNELSNLRRVTASEHAKIHIGEKRPLMADGWKNTTRKPIKCSDCGRTIMRKQRKGFCKTCRFKRQCRGMAEKQIGQAESAGWCSEADLETSVASVVSIWEDAGNQEVFNLQVTDCHEYFANGILVHNCDELVPPDWIEALIFRLVNRNGHMLITFTPVEHFSDTVKMYLSGAQTIESEKAELLPIFGASGELAEYETVPRVQQSGVSTARIIYFHTKDNPFGNYEGMKAELRGSPPERIKLRAYGIPTASQGSQFSFDEHIHKITRAEFQAIVKAYPNGTRYLLVDPCSGRNWFMGWGFCPYNVEVVNADGTTSTQPKLIWYREWPSPGKYIEGVGDPGPWAVIGGTLVRHDGGKSPADGDRGPAQKPFRFGLRRYIEEILRCERIPALISGKSDGKQERITERYIDSRYANSAVTDREEQTTLIEQLQSLGMIFLAMVAERKILDVNDGSIDLINSALYYDKALPIGQFSPEMGRLNEPLMQVTEDCPNMIFSLTNWTGLDGQHGACKDPIDIIRGFYLTRLCHIDAAMFETKGGGCY